MDVSVEIHCETCGSANYSLPDGAPTTRRSAATIAAPPRARSASSGALLEQAIDQSAEALRGDLDKLRTASSYK